MDVELTNSSCNKLLLCIQYSTAIRVVLQKKTAERERERERQRARKEMGGRGTERVRDGDTSLPCARVHSKLSASMGICVCLAYITFMPDLHIAHCFLLCVRACLPSCMRVYTICRTKLVGGTTRIF